MADNNFFKVKQGLNIAPSTNAPSEKGSVVYDSATDVVKYYDGASRTVVNTDGTQTLSNKTLTGNTAVNLVSGAATVTLPTTTSTLATLALSETLTNKTLTSPSITTPSTDVITLDGQASAPSNPSSGYYKIYVSDTSSKLTVLDSNGVETAVGGGSGLKNYIDAPDAEAGTTGWSTYADAAGTRPVDGTGGSPTVTWGTSSTTPLDDNKDFNFVKDAANRQGEGVAYAFSIDRADQGKPLQIEFDWELVSGTFTGSTVPATDSDVIVYIYDVTNATLIEPQGRLLEPAVTGMFYRYRGTFQTSINSQSYRLIFHCATTSASAYTLAFDNVRVGPQVVSNGAVVTDWKSANSVAAGTLITATTTAPTYGSITTNTVYWRRVGGEAEIIWTYHATSGGAAGSGCYLFNIPSEIGTIDTTKVTIAPNAPNATTPPTGGTTVAEGVVAVTTAGDTNYNGSLWGMVYSTTALALFTPGGTAADRAFPFSSSNGQNFSINPLFLTLRVKVPISGWSSNVQMSSDSDTRVVAAICTGNPASAAGGAAIIFPTATYDSHGAYSVSTGLYTVPVSGVYQLSGSVNSTAAGGSVMQIYKNGSSYSTVGAVNSNGGGPFSGLVQANAGDTLSIRCNNTCDADGSSSLNIQRLSGPAQIAASEKVYAIVTGDPASATSGNPLIVPTVSNDSHGGYNASTGRYTCPIAGVYKMFGALTSASSATTLTIYKNASSNILAGNLDSNGEATYAAMVNCNAGDIIDIRPGGTVDATSMSLCIERL